MRIFILVAVLMGSLLPMQAQAQTTFWDGNRLVTDMRSWEKFTTRQTLTSVEWVRVGSYQRYVAAATFDSGEVICLSGDVTRGQINAIVAAYLNAHQADWHLPATSLVRDALMEAFPCYSSPSHLGSVRDR